MIGPTSGALLEHLGATAVGAFLHPGLLHPPRFDRKQEHRHLLISPESSSGFCSLDDICEESRTVWPGTSGMEPITSEY